MSGDVRVFLVINTTEYNNDGKWAVVDASFAALRCLGFDDEEVDKIDGMSIGESASDFAFHGVIIVRVA